MIREVDIGFVEVEIEFASSKDNPHVPGATDGERFGFASGSGGKVCQLEIAILIESDFDVAQFLSSLQRNLTRFDNHISQVNSIIVISFDLLKGAMPVGVKAKDLDASQDTVGIFFGRDIADSHGVGQKERRRSNLPGQ